ncbi:MAG: hypothetical protein ACP5UD_06860 [Conexivisphaera sp.]
MTRLRTDSAVGLRIVATEGAGAESAVPRRANWAVGSEDPGKGRALNISSATSHG